MLTKLNVLVLEDEPLIALDIEDTLERAGFGRITLLHTCRDALHFLAQERPDVALIDVQLQDGVCNEVAEHLAAANVPFVVYSGLEEAAEELGESFRRGRWLLKPASAKDLVEALEGSVAGA
ncbi:response regulator [Rhizobium sp. Leaf341]|uniref:response regulator n=1 Tax=Rhizobium sp. Leaf341 TaxID=1736344 RepID=UPI000714CBBA|nr:response regulator [Rhizobium sp. Leaf341]KQR77554.1 hypothetical protein ASG03_14170 [Rhizobium sp. Leaf341]